MRQESTQPSSTRPLAIPDNARFSAGHETPWHSHQTACLIYPAEGVVTVETAAGQWVVPPQRAVWLPAGVPHQSRSKGLLELRSLDLDTRALPGLPRHSCLLGITALQRELILQASLAPTQDLDSPEGRLIAVLRDQLEALPLPALQLPLPRDRRLQRLTQALIADPADKRDLEAWGREVGASSRTLARLFRIETGMTFRTWRHQLRVLAALRRLAAGQTVTTVALEVGFETSSAFVQSFKRALGKTPGRYFAA